MDLTRSSQEKKGLLEFVGALSVSPVAGRLVLTRSSIRTSLLVDWNVKFRRGSTTEESTLTEFQRDGSNHSINEMDERALIRGGRPVAVVWETVAPRFSRY